MRTVLIVLFLAILPITCIAWGEKAHSIINRLAIEASASVLPEFMNASREQIIYNGFEPDRWRDEARSPMHVAQVDHWRVTDQIEASDLLFAKAMSD